MTQSVTNIIIAAAAVIGLIPLGIAAAPAQGRQKKTRPPFPALGTTTSVEVDWAAAPRWLVLGAQGDTGVVADVVVRAGGAAGIAGPAVFTSAWIVSSLRQTGHSAADLQISGLAAPDARDPWVMIAGFLVLGGCSVTFGAALHDAMGGRDHAGPGPRLIQGAGVLAIAAGLLRRDHMLLTSGSVSWHNHAHDVVSVVLYVDLVLAQLLLARRFGREQRQPGWRAWRAGLMASAGVTAALLIAFAADTSAPSAGVLQRAAVTIPLAVIAAMAVRLVKTAETGG